MLLTESDKMIARMGAYIVALETELVNVRKQLEEAQAKTDNGKQGSNKA